MATTAQATLDFRVIAQEVTSANRKDFDTSRELIPAEGAARQEREGKQFMRRPDVPGATVDQEGLNNTYAVLPKAYLADFPSPEQARSYLVQGVIAALFVTSLVVTAFVVS